MKVCDSCGLGDDEYWQLKLLLIGKIVSGACQATNFFAATLLNNICDLPSVEVGELHKTKKINWLHCVICSH